MEFVNNVTRYLDKQKVNYRLLTYEYDAGVHSAVEVAAAVGLPPEQVFKTLVALPTNQDENLSLSSFLGQILWT